MKIPLLSPKATELLTEVTKLEERRREIALEANRLLKRAEKLPDANDRYLIVRWLRHLIDDGYPL